MTRDDISIVLGYVMIVREENIQQVYIGKSQINCELSGLKNSKLFLNEKRIL